MRARDRGHRRISLKNHLVLLLIAGCAALAEPPLLVRYEPSSPPVVSAMLELAQVTSSDVVYDLGCGDGRIVIEAARRYGARGVCVDIDPRRIAEARANAADAGVARLLEFREEDLMRTELRGATVVTLFLSYEMNLALEPRLLKLPAGTRVVSHWHGMRDWAPEKTIYVGGATERRSEVFLFRSRGPSRGSE